jgi:uncharacterized membrane protein (DUF106 family)
MDTVTQVMTWLGDLVFALLSVIPPVWALVVISALTGVAMLYIWRYTSNQKAIADVRNKISANLLATRLFKDNLSVTFRAQRQILWQATRLLGHSVRPMLIMLVPFVLIMVQIGLHYEFRPLAVGKRARIKVTLKEGVVSKDADWKGLAESVVLPEGLSAQENDPCRVTARRTMDWRITPGSPGDFTLTFRAGHDSLDMPLTVGDGLRRISTIRGGGFWDRLLYSAEPSIPQSSVFESVQVYYPARATPILGYDVHWLITLLVLSIVFALIVKPLVNVHI